ncbi:molybdopterin molybdotransferase MoeA [Leucobacter sp. W1478]|uniref:molybdopterin molybdotransferase MoeA n=1 Tax=Leucobacter sp. W1478 TaxID=3439065 RepID=UPI003F4088E2
MRSVAEHLEWILARTELLSVRELPLAEAHGLTLAEAVTARHDLPLWDSSAMDGYAVRAADVSGAMVERPVPLRVVAEVAAGSSENPSLQPGEAARIMTGAPVPSDADAVVPVEITLGDEAGNPWARTEVRVVRAVHVGANVRQRGEDRKMGDPMAEDGVELGPLRLSALAAAGIDRVLVRPRPRVAVIVTGSELVPPGQAPRRGEIPESNSLLLGGLLRELGIVPEEVRVSRDTVEGLRRTLDELGERVDVILTTGGIGPGLHDVVRMAVENEPEIAVVRVAVKPGQPQCAGRLRSGAWLFALPGNPVSAAVGFELFVRPALLAAQGRRSTARLRLPATAAVGWRGAEGRAQVLPVSLRLAENGLVCEPTVSPRAVSHAVGGQGAAAGFAWVPEHVGDVDEGDSVEVWRLGSW